MKKILVFTMVMFFGLTLSANAALQKITFDEPGINMGDKIVDQYSEIGFGFDYPNKITNTTEFNNGFNTDGNILQYTSKNNKRGIINLSSLCDSLTFEYRRPSSSGSMTFELYNSTNLVYSKEFNWNSGKWDTFIFNDESTFNQIVMKSNKKFIIDNLEVNTVPVPASLLLLLSGFLPFTWLCRNK